MENHGKSSIYGWFSQISHSKFGFSSHGKAMLITRGQKLELQAAPASIFGPKDGISLKVPLSVRRQKPISVLVKTGESFSEFLDLVLSTFQGCNCCDSLFDMAASSRCWWSPSSHKKRSSFSWPAMMWSAAFHGQAERGDFVFIVQSGNQAPNSMHFNLS